MATSIQMPQEIDSLPQIFWWEADQFGIFICFFGIGLITHSMLSSLAVGAVINYIVGKSKDGSLDGVAFHLMCLTGLFSLNNEFDDLLEDDLYL